MTFQTGKIIRLVSRQILTGDSGCAGFSLIEHHNTLTISDKGQAISGDGHDAFAGNPYARSNKIRISDVTIDGRRFR